MERNIQPAELGDKTSEQGSFAVSSPSISVPKGGGAIRGIGEKFAANPVTGTGSMSVPIAVSPGRSGFNPELSLSYDSGAGNGPFGFGWSLSIPMITRKTDKGLPTYNDAEESDVYILSGAEDLVPFLGPDGTRLSQTRSVNGVTYRIHRYRPRFEGLFARIERWTNATTGEIHWRSISRDNITTLYGKDNASRIFDPENPQRVFSWLICQSYDDKGNAMVYQYQAEDSHRIFEDQQGQPITLAHESNRTETRRTANRYLKRIRYGNRTPNRSTTNWEAFDPSQLPDDDWMFEVVFDYGEGHYSEDPPDNEGRIFVQAKNKPPDDAYWPVRPDPFSTYRAGFEVRTYRLCRRVLMFHHFPKEQDVGRDCLVRSTDFTYTPNQEPASAPSPVNTFLFQVTQSGYKQRETGRYLKRSLPSIEFGYTQPRIQDTVEEIDSESLENLPVGVDGVAYQWVDLHGEGIPGILSEQAGTWFYKRNLSPIGEQHDNGTPSLAVKFAPTEQVATKPNLTLAAGAQFMDLAGDGQADLVMLDDPMPGLYEHDGSEGWQSFRPFTSRLNRDFRDPNLKFIDLDGDGHADILITENDAFVWHASLAEEGFGPARRVTQSLDEEKGPRIVFADGTQSIYLADLSGDGLTDIVRVRNGEVCYWPNLGYARFGAKIIMDNAPWFDQPDQFDQKRIRLVDIDGTGTTDLIYLHREGIRLYFNQSGNSWSEVQKLAVFPRIDDLVNIVTTDLLGNGTACLVWSSPLPGDAGRQMRYVNLMGGQKPHLLFKTINNLGAETRVDYAPSTKFYLRDKRDGKPWITRLPFPVHVVERVETYDHISRNRFVTRYAYHHGHFDGDEREFRGFGMVEQWDTEHMATLNTNDHFPVGDNISESSHVPPVYTRSWFHTGIYMDRQHISRQFEHEYYREPGLSDDEFRARLLPDTTLPEGLTPEEEREACRALKGMLLRQEVYADDADPDASAAEIARARTPYTVIEQDFTIRPLQLRAGNRHAVFFTHPREAITYHYERNPSDPRIQHALTLEVDAFGNVLKEAAIGYGPRLSPLSTQWTQWDKDRQMSALLTYTENHVTHAIDDADAHPDDYRTPLPCETQTFELTDYQATGAAGRYCAEDLVEPDPAQPGRLRHKETEGIAYEKDATGKPCRRLIERMRTLYRSNDCGVSQNDPLELLALGVLQSMALTGESYRLAFTPGLISKVFTRNNQPLLPDPAAVLGGAGDDRGGYVDLDGDGNWWIPSGRIFLSPTTEHSAAEELNHARGHFFLPHRTRNPFHTDAVRTESFVTYDAYDLLLLETEDALGNRVTVGERDENGAITLRANDYRVLQPRQASDPNRNRSAVAFDTLGMVVGTAVMGKPEENLGDTLDGFAADLNEKTRLDHLLNPLANPHTILHKATTRLVYDLFAYQRTKNEPQPQPVVAYTLVRETHDSDLNGEQTKIQHSFAYSDGFGREIQQKIQAEPEKINSVPGPPRWVGSGWTIFNNKGKPVRQYEPFFSQLPPDQRHRFEFNAKYGVSPVLFYDPLGRVVATLHPNHTYEKVVFDPWQQTTHDVNDTIRKADAHGKAFNPKDDPDVGQYFARLPDDEYLPTWYDLRIDTDKAKIAWPDNTERRASEKAAAEKAAAHAGTPATAHFDSLGRPFMTVTRNRVVCTDHPLDGKPDEEFCARVELDIEGNQRAVWDVRRLPDNHLPTGALQQRIVMRYAYDMLGNRIHQESQEAGARWMLNDVAGKPVRAWDSRGHDFHKEYDPLRRPVRTRVAGIDPASAEQMLTARLVYGEQHPNAEKQNLQGQVWLHLDQAGIVANETYDFKGNLRSSSRRLAKEFRQTVSWSAIEEEIPSDSSTTVELARLDADLAVLVEQETFTAHTRFDALNRPIQMIAPHSSQADAKRSVIQPGYNEAGLLERVDVWLDQPEQPKNNEDPENRENLKKLLDMQIVPPAPVGVENIDYDAKGQRLRIDYKNGAATHYEYDQQTFRLLHLYTRRGATYTADCGIEPAPDKPPQNQPCGLQNLHYTYDPAGNITRIRDSAQQSIYFKNKCVEPSNDYTYDALYRLIQATGREHLGQNREPVPHSCNDAFRAGMPHPNDCNPMGAYIERYVYDAVGNFLQMQHRGTDPEHPGWTRTYTHDELSLIEQDKMNNRLSSTQVGNGITSTPERYQYDAHGNVQNMPQLEIMQWDYQDQLHMTQRQKVNGTDADGEARHGERTWYVYDASGQRVRKVTELANGNLKDERIYLGGFEIYRCHSGRHSGLVRESLHIMDDRQRIALVETRNNVDDGTAKRLIRYQFGNHLGSASLELNEHAQIVSYEEYSPYGSTTYQGVNKGIKAAGKRYRYTGKERDEESGLYYYGARYYAPWVGRWVSCDPIGLSANLDLYKFCSNSPILRVDPDGYADILVNEVRSFAERTGDISTVGSQAYYDNLGSSTMMSIREPQESVVREALPSSVEKIIGDMIMGSLWPRTRIRAQRPAVPDVINAGTSFDDIIGKSDRRDAQRVSNFASGVMFFANQALTAELTLLDFAGGVTGGAVAIRAAQVASKQQVRLLIRASDEFGEFILSKAKLSRNERGPVLSTVLDTETGEIFQGLNIGRKGAEPSAEEIEHLKSILHPLLKERMEKQEMLVMTMIEKGEIPEEVAKASIAGTHSEVIALNHAIKARIARTGRDITQEQLSTFLLYNKTLIGPRTGGSPPPCFHCSKITKGVITLFDRASHSP